MTESLDPQGNLEKLEKLDLLVSLAHLDPKETWEVLDQKEVLVYKVPEETLVSLEILESLVKWVHPEKMD